MIEDLSDQDIPEKNIKIAVKKKIGTMYGQWIRESASLGKCPTK